MNAQTSTVRKKTFTLHHRPRFKAGFFRLLPMFLLLILLSACQAGGGLPQPFCDAFNNSIYTLRLAGGAGVILGLAMLGFKKNLSTILPSQGAQTGAIASSLLLGVGLLALSSDIGGEILGTLGLPNIIGMC